MAHRSFSPLYATTVLSPSPKVHPVTQEGSERNDHVICVFGPEYLKQVLCYRYVLLCLREKKVRLELKGISGVKHVGKRSAYIKKLR